MGCLIRVSGVRVPPPALLLNGSTLPGDLDGVPDYRIDDVNVKVYTSRSWLTVRGTI
jgi:hypothetical protein